MIDLEKTEVVKMKKGRKGYYYMIGQILHPKDEPNDYRIELRKRKYELFILIGEKGVYVLDRDILEKISEKQWLKYLEKYKNSPRRGTRAKSDKVRHPNAIYEDTIREVLIEKGYSPCSNKTFINFETEKSDNEDVAKEILNEIIQIAEKAKKKVGV